MRTLVVLGANRAIRDQLHSRWPDYLVFRESPAEAMDALDSHQGALLAYGPGIFGAATTKQPARIWTGEPQVILTDSADFDGMAYDDPRKLVERAAAVLRVSLVLNVSKDAALDLLGKMLCGE